jgi:hypothetical protein
MILHYEIILDSMAVLLSFRGGRRHSAGQMNHANRKKPR